MIRKERFKQIFLISIAFFLIFFGYLNYNFFNNTVEVASHDNEINLGDVQLVSSDNVENNTITAIVPNDKDSVSNVIEENIVNKVVVSDTETNTSINDYSSFSASYTEENYFEETKIEREKMYSEMLETYKKIVNNGEISSEQKAIAMQEISNITNLKNGIMISENLIKNKGFDNAVILVNNGKVNVIVKHPNLNKEQISQIQNIVERELNVTVDDINISSK